MAQVKKRIKKRLVKKGPFTHVAAAVVQQYIFLEEKNLRILLLPFILYKIIITQLDY